MVVQAGGRGFDLPGGESVHESWGFPAKSGRLPGRHSLSGAVGCCCAGVIHAGDQDFAIGAASDVEGSIFPRVRGGP